MSEAPVSALSVASGKVISRTAIYFAAVVVTIGAVSLVLLSPLLLRQLGRFKGVDWTRLSNSTFAVMLRGLPRPGG